MTMMIKTLNVGHCHSFQLHVFENVFCLVSVYSLILHRTLKALSKMLGWKQRLLT